MVQGHHRSQVEVEHPRASRITARAVRADEGADLRMRTAAVALVALLLALVSVVGLGGSPARASELAGFAPAGGAVSGLATAANGDVMPSFDATFDVDAQGGATVTETISYTFGSQGGVRHGIYRAITTEITLPDSSETGLYRYTQLSDVSVSSPSGAPTNVTTSTSGQQTILQIGDKNKTVSGTQTYVVKYHLSKVVNAIAATGTGTGTSTGTGSTSSGTASTATPTPASSTQALSGSVAGDVSTTGEGDTAELYYNVFKDDQIPKTKTSVKVTGPVAATAARCAVGESGPCSSTTAGNPASFTTGQLPAYTDLTIATSYPRSAFGDLTPDIRPKGSALPTGASKALGWGVAGLGVLLPLLAIGAVVSTYARKGRDEWYAGLAPGNVPTRGAESATPTRRGSMGPIAVQFAPPPGVQPGLVGTVIDESADTIDVSATLIDLAVRGYLRIEETSKGGAFSRTDWLLTKLVPTEPAGSLQPYEQTILAKVFEESNPILMSALRNHFATTLSTAKSQMYQEVVQRGWFRKSPQAMKAGWVALGTALVVIGLAAATIGTGALGPSLRGASLPVPPTVIFGIGMLIAGIVTLVLGNKMASRTPAGSAVYAQSMGFKEYLVTADANQIKWEEAAGIFSRYLPYAIVFGVAKKWAATFQQVAEAAEAAGQPLMMPTWYIWSGAMFPNFGSMADSVDNFATSSAGTFTATPGGSGGSGFSGGGGFGGGGFGGSSSGSW